MQPIKKEYLEVYIDTLEELDEIPAIESIKDRMGTPVAVIVKDDRRIGGTRFVVTGVRETLEGDVVFYERKTNFEVCDFAILRAYHCVKEQAGIDLLGIHFVQEEEYLFPDFLDKHLES